VGRIGTRVDPRKMMALGILILSWSLWAMTKWTPDVAEGHIITVIVVQGVGMGLVFVPMQVVAFTTLAPVLRTEGAGLLSLFRNVGSAIGVSVTSSLLAHNIQVLHSQLASNLTPFNRVLQQGGPAGALINPHTARGAQLLDLMVNHQAQIIAYVDDFKMMMLTTLPTLALLFLMRRPPRAAAVPADAHAAMD
jgi:MFS transporter, DHA2 family, multidrug resistance protein